MHGVFEQDREIAAALGEGATHHLQRGHAFGAHADAGEAHARQFAQGQQVAFAEKMTRRAFGLFGQVDLAGFEAAELLVGGQVDDDDFVGLVKEAIGHRLPHADAGDATDHVVEAFEVLHVQG